MCGRLVLIGFLFFSFIFFTVEYGRRGREFAGTCILFDTKYFGKVLIQKTRALDDLSAVTNSMSAWLFLSPHV